MIKNHFILLALISLIISTSCTSNSIGTSGFCEEGETEDCTVVIDPDGSEGEETPVADADVTCAAENDCDGDGVFTSCDQDDGDATEKSVKSACDEDEDGYVDLACTAYDMARDTNGDGTITIDERDVNCDVCTDEYDPDQTDSDDDGVGDACDFVPDVTATDDSTVDDDEAADDENDGDDEIDDDADAGEEVATPENTDADGDGLAASIDPDDTTRTDWGFINRDSGTPVCLMEQDGFEYIYIAGTKSKISPATPIGGKLDAAGIKRQLQTGIIGLTGKSFTRFGNRRVNVEGVLDRSQANLDTIGFGGASCPTELEYGIYIVIPDSGIKSSGITPGKISPVQVGPLMNRPGASL